MSVTAKIELNLVCVDCGYILHWFQENSPWTEIPVLRVQTCPHCLGQQACETDAATVEWVCACGLSQSQHVGTACEHRPASDA